MSTRDSEIQSTELLRRYMYQVNMVFILVKYPNKNHEGDGIIESVWTSEELARSAIHYHAMNDMQAGFEFDLERYVVVERFLNQARKI